MEFKKFEILKNFFCINNEKVIKVDKCLYVDKYVAKVCELKKIVPTHKSLMKLEYNGYLLLNKSNVKETTILTANITQYGRMWLRSKGIKLYNFDLKSEKMQDLEK